ncbi:chemotaxis protein CheA [Acidocella aromatica]|uniref:Chemotaxis protein CheA n=1 Tax=Acidocella aromatica TaxID=1303579 RepID=A0A840VHV2_9PROT|nr:chemotaxis protein CheA [Acidocella aromatica]MBB5371879.1 two-component system chemotaxis sensor kinase CheA [Acidocella aromatica]
MEDPMAEIRATFFQECDEQLAALEAGLLEMQSGTAEAETVNAVFRAVHSMKGGAGIFSLDALVRFAHKFETALDKVRSGELVATPSVVGVFLRAADVLSDVVHAAQEGGAVDEGRISALVAELEHISDPVSASENNLATPVAVVLEETGGAWDIVFAPRSEMYAKANEAALLLRELGRLGTMKVTLDSSKLPELSVLDPEGAYLSWKIALDAECDELTIRNVFEFVEDDCELTVSRSDLAGFAPGTVITGDNGFKFEFFAPMPEVEEEMQVEDVHVPENEHHEALPPKHTVVEAIAAKAESATTVSATIRVDLDRVDRMIDLVGELVINEAMLSQRVMEAGIARASGVAMALEELEHLTREIQDSVMAIRAQPVRSVFQRMPRLVREVAAQTGKQVRLVTEGEGTEVDKTVIERITDPLTHMIRNAIDHGLETPEKRVTAGKPEEGTVKLTALHRSGRIVLEVSDDGAGINRARVKQKAIENGVIAPDAQLTDDEIDNLIFLPGFSTASKISDISGRGVGMDVVRQSVQALGGRISISSRPGQGSTFTLSLPLTLAVLDGMVVSTRDHTLIIPLGAIVETLKPQMKDVFPLDHETNLLVLRGGYVPMVDVAASLGYCEDPIEPEQGVALLVEGEGGVRAVLLVDAIHGQRQVVIKSLEANYRAVPGIAAATVMGDGRVALILDVDAVVRNARGDSGRSEAAMVEAG